MKSGPSSLVVFPNQLGAFLSRSFALVGPSRAFRAAAALCHEHGQEEPGQEADAARCCRRGHAQGVRLNVGTMLTHYVPTPLPRRCETCKHLSQEVFVHVLTPPPGEVFVTGREVLDTLLDTVLPAADQQF